LRSPSCTYIYVVKTVVFVNSFFCRTCTYVHM
jgi:hypothetical protein